MTKREPIKTTKEEIASYWDSRIDESELNIDFCEAKERCWRCARKARLNRCHIIPYSLNGKDTPSNFVLLCRWCHREGPNVEDPDIMWDWIKSYKVLFYDTFWFLQGLDEYENIYGITFENDLVQHNIDEKDFNNLDLKFLFQKASIHFGDPHFNRATIAGLLRIFIKNPNDFTKRF